MSKRFFDICFSGLALLLISPLFLLCAIAVKLSSPGPIFYAHQRIGENRKRFGCWKFRTMYADADARLHCLLASSPMLMQEWQVFFKLKEDPRITPIGKWLRKLSLDELPQFWNVFRGDMSVVGPRPLTEKEIVEYLKERADKILSVRPGLTTLWITEGRNHFSLEQRIALEEFYVDHRSFWLDLKLIVKTVLIMLFPKGAY
jgi:undecaprenyl-phosphate galactose phosphotransferase